MKAVALVGSDPQIKKMYEDRRFHIVDNVEHADIVTFIGGSDLNPELYSEKRIHRTVVNHREDTRDLWAWNKLKPKQMKIGICRGGQFLNVMNGGSLWQHVSGHGMNHEIECAIFNKKINVTSTHHQMMIPSEKTGGEILAFAYDVSRDHMSYNKLRQEQGHNKVDPEVIYYERTNSLCFQPHPEFYIAGECRDYFFDLIELLKP